VQAVDPLTDEHVAALAQCRWTWAHGGHAVDANGEYPDHVEIAALALEVQAARARRCGNCDLWRHEPDIDAHLCERMPSLRFETTADWFCADFTPREALCKP
jgi:hypothetical protein